MSNISGFKEKMLSGQILAGTFLKTPNYILVEVLAQRSEERRVGKECER